MKRIIIPLLISLFMPAYVYGEIVDDVEFEVETGLANNPKLQKSIEKQAAKLLTMLNERETANSPYLNFNGIDITDEARTIISDIWQYNHIRTLQMDPEVGAYIQGKVLRTPYNEYEVRDIPMLFRPVEAPDSANREEIAIQFNASGSIVGLSVTPGTQQFTQMLEDMAQVSDQYQRTKVIYWMDQLCTAYNRRDIAWFQQFFSEDVIVITGCRRTAKGSNSDGGVRLQGEWYDYNVQNKQQYLGKLQKIFKNNRSINIRFGDDFEISGYPSGQRYYAVEVTQYWNTTSYSDVGRLFVIWDFGMSDPQILMRAWTEPSDPRRFTFDDLEGLR